MIHYCAMNFTTVNERGAAFGDMWQRDLRAEANLARQVSYWASRSNRFRRMPALAICDCSQGMTKSKRPPIWDPLTLPVVTLPARFPVRVPGAPDPGGWDTHAYNFKLLRENLPRYDHAIAALINDLDDRGRLDDTAIVVWGEFGRRPKVGNIVHTKTTT